MEVGLYLTREKKEMKFDIVFKIIFLILMFMLVYYMHDIRKNLFWLSKETSNIEINLQTLNDTIQVSHRHY
jgi:hypothetical protein